MKKTLKIFGLIAVLAIIAFTFAGCKEPGTDEPPPPVTQAGSPLPDLPGEVTISPNSGVVTGVELTATYGGSETVSFQWKKNGSNVGTSSTTNPNSYTPQEAGTYTVTVSAEGYNPKNSNSVNVTLFTPIAGLYAKAPPILPGDTKIETVTANDITAAVTYVKANVGTYTLVINNDVEAAPQTLNTANVKLTIIGVGGERQIKLSSNGALFTVGGATGIELTIGNNITLVGRRSGGNGNADNNSCVVNVTANGSFTMLEGSKVTGNRAGLTATGAGSAVNVDGGTSTGTFTMDGGAITENDVNHPTGSALLRTGGLRTSTTAIVNLNGGRISGNTGAAMGIDIVLPKGANLTLSGSAVIGGIALHSDPTPSDISIASGWSGNIGTLHLAGNGANTTVVINTWENQAVLKGAGLNAAAVTRVTLGDFYCAQKLTGEAGINQPITNTHKIADSGADIGKLVRTAFISAPVLTLTPGNTELTYTWTDSNPVATTYDVYWKAGDNLSADEVKTGTPILGATTGGKITGLTDNTPYSVVVVANKAGFTNSIDSAVKTATPGITYIITGSGTSFTATRDDANVTGAVNQPIQTVITAIRSNANGAACTIQFGINGATLDIGTAFVEFFNSGGNWNNINLTGAITGSDTNTIRVSNDSTFSITSNANITNTNYSGYAISRNTGNGTVNISGGTVSVTGGESSRAIDAGSSTVNISGGTVSAVAGRAVQIYTGGKVTVSQASGATTRITSANTATSYGTIYNYGGQLEITGGTIENTSTTTGNAICNRSSGTVNISGGTVSKAGTGNYAINNDGGGVVTIGAGATIVGNNSGVN